MRLVCVSVLLLLCANVFAQDTITSVTKKDSVFSPPEKIPEFPGGEQALYKFLANNLKYPKEAAEKQIGGKVFVRFMVDQEGNVTDVTIYKGVSPEMDAEAIRIVKLMPKWKPGAVNGRSVSIIMTLPIVFTPK